MEKKNGIRLHDIPDHKIRIDDRNITLPGAHTYPSKVAYVGDLTIVLFLGHGNDFTDSNIRAYNTGGELIWEVESARAGDQSGAYIDWASDESNRLILQSWTGYFYLLDVQTGKITAADITQAF